MSISASILPEFDMEMAKTRTTLERTPDDCFGWKPHEKSFSMMEQVNHLARLSGWGAETLRTPSMDLDPDGTGYVPPPPAETTQAVLELFDAGVADFRDALAAASDDDLMAPWTLYMAGEEIFTMPRIAVIRGMILNHIIHHRGQLTIYFRLNGVPVPALYGPSADEEM